jgi:hypothetical protein
VQRLADDRCAVIVEVLLSVQPAAGARFARRAAGAEPGLASARPQPPVGVEFGIDDGERRRHRERALAVGRRVAERAEEPLHVTRLDREPLRDHLRLLDRFS